MPTPETPEPIALGPSRDPQVANLLDELDDFLDQGGVDTSVICAREVTRLRKLEGMPSAIPPRETWRNVLRVCLYGFMPIRNDCGFPIIVLGGYRTNAYNATVRGHRASRHLFGEALDLAPVLKGLSKEEAEMRRLELGKAAARLFRDHGDDHGGMGFGAYGRPGPGRIHIDLGHRRRWWDDACYYTNLVAGETREPSGKTPANEPPSDKSDVLAKLAAKRWDDARYDPKNRDGFVQAVSRLETEIVPRTERDWRLFERGFMAGNALASDG